MPARTEGGAKKPVHRNDFPRTPLPPSQFFWIATINRHDARTQLSDLVLEDSDNVVFGSTISAHEMSLTRYRWPESLLGAFEAVVAAEGFDRLPLSAAHAIQVGSYGHRDPFDRMLAAQVEGLVTDGRAIAPLGARVVWG